MTGLGGFGALRARRRIEAEGVVSRSGVPSARLEVGSRFMRDSGLGVEVGGLNILSCCISSITLRLAMLVLVKINLPVNFCLASAPDFRLNSHFEVKSILVWGLGGVGLPPLGCRHPCHPPLGHFGHPSYGGCHPGGGGGYVRVFNLSFLPAHPSQVPVRVNNVAVQGGGDHPCQ